MNKDTIINFYHKYKLYIFPAAVSLSSLFLIIFAIYPQTVKLVTNQKVQGELEEKSKFLEVKAQALAGFDESDLSRKVEYALYSYPQDKDFGNVIGLLQSIAAKSGFEISAINLEGGAGKASGSEGYNVKVGVSGTKGLLPAFLNNIESSIRLMKVISLDISVKNNQNIDAILGVEVLFSPAPQNFGSIDSPLPGLSGKDEELLATLANSLPAAVSLGGEAVTTPRGKANPFE